jgi:DNA mismatch endonuclease, patch repair protein
MVDQITPERRSWNMARIHSDNTVPEVKLRSMLHRRGFRFRLHKKDLPGKPDIVLSKYKTVILVHGCFWHGHPNCKEAHIPKTNTSYWHPKIERNIERDKRNEQLLREKGWTVIKIWECEIKYETIVFDRIRMMLKKNDAGPK